MEHRERGKISSVDRRTGVGRIATERGDTVPFFKSSTMFMGPFDDLLVGRAVEFTLTRDGATCGVGGKLRAVGVCLK